MNHPKFDKAIKAFKKQFETALNSSLSGYDLPCLYDPVAYTFNLGGKRVRPQLVALGAGLIDPEVKLEQVVPAALAVEMLHNFTLIHDDIMDEASTRRGQTAVHRKWDSSTAILSGDVLFGLASQQLQAYTADEFFSRSQIQQLYDIYFWGVRTVCEGQARDMDFEMRADVNVDEYLHMIEQKTAALLSVSLRMGGVIAGADAEQLEHLDKLGIDIGLAFQIQDDYLDIYGDPDLVGKRKAGDLYEGKKTWPTLKALSVMKEDESQRVTAILQQENRSKDDIETLIGLFEISGIETRCSEAIEHYYQDAAGHIAAFSDSEYKKELESLLETLVKRKH